MSPELHVGCSVLEQERAGVGISAPPSTSGGSTWPLLPGDEASRGLEKHEAGDISCGELGSQLSRALDWRKFLGKKRETPPLDRSFRQTKMAQSAQTAEVAAMITTGSTHESMSSEDLEMLAESVLGGGDGVVETRMDWSDGKPSERMALRTCHP